MLKELIATLRASDHFGISERIDIAKGKYKLSASIREIIAQKKRNK